MATAVDFRLFYAAVVTSCVAIDFYCNFLLLKLTSITSSCFVVGAVVSIEFLSAVSLFHFMLYSDLYAFESIVNF